MGHPLSFNFSASEPDEKEGLELDVELKIIVLVIHFEL